MNKWILVVVSFNLLIPSCENSTKKQLQNSTTAFLSNNSIKPEILKPSVDKQLPEPFDIKNIDDLEFTSGMVSTTKAYNKCFNVKTSSYGAYYLIDSKYSKTSNNLSSSNIITVRTPNEANNCKSTDTNQTVIKIHLKSDIIAVWDSIRVGISKTAVDEFTTNNLGYCKKYGNGIYLCDYDNFLAFYIFKKDTLKEMKIFRSCLFEKSIKPNIYREGEVKMISNKHFKVVSLDFQGNDLLRIFIAFDSTEITNKGLIQEAICQVKKEYKSEYANISFFTDEKYANYKHELLFEDHVESNYWLNNYYLGEYDGKTSKFSTYPSATSLNRKTTYLVDCNKE